MAKDKEWFMTKNGTHIELDEEVAQFMKKQQDELYKMSQLKVENFRIEAENTRLKQYMNIRGISAFIFGVGFASVVWLLVLILQTNSFTS